MRAFKPYMLAVNFLVHIASIAAYTIEQSAVNFNNLPSSYDPKLALKDILTACSDNLTGMSEAIAAVYPATEHQLSIVDRIRSSLA